MVERREACPEWREDLAAWAVAQGSPEREALLVEHLAGCAACRAEADSLLAVAAVVLAVDADPAVGTPATTSAGASRESEKPPADLGAAHRRSHRI